MEVELISSETIRPSSPTPPHLQTFKTSIVDKILPPGAYIQLMSFYTSNQTSIQLLKTSLSQSLTVFYPFAGRIEQNSIIDCNDHGVLFTTARVNSSLRDLLSPKPKLEDFPKFSTSIPPFCPDDEDRPTQIGIQVNEFSCGGIGICITFSHFIIDAATIGIFLKYWSKTAKFGSDTISTISNSIEICPAASMYPQGSENPMPPELSSIPEFTLLREGKGITKRFVFDDLAITALKEKAKSEVVCNPTRVEAVSGFMWKHMMAASESVWGCKQPSILIQAADLRRRMDKTASSEFSVGNILWKSIAHYHNVTLDNDAEVDEKQLVELLREAIEKVKHEFVPKLFSRGGYETVRDSLIELTQMCSDKNLNPYTISSWCKTGISEIDFGWGKPLWVALLHGELEIDIKNVAVLMDGEETESIDAWITLDKREMRVLESDNEFLRFASLNPPVSI